MNELIVLLDGGEAGTVTSDKGRLTFSYTDSWRNAPNAFPLSLSMPLAAKVHTNAAMEPFVWGLLPDNEQVLRSWGQKFQVSPRNAFALISHVGEDCAGAVQFVRHENLSAVLEQVMPEPDWLSESQVAARLRAVKADASAGRMPGDKGQFSLAGAQPKTALHFYQQRWGVTAGRTPTTHILKPASAELAGHAENEYLCLRLATSLGLSTTEAHVHYFEDVPTIVVERYDRVNVAEAATNRRANAANLFSKATELKARGEKNAEVEAIELEAQEDLELSKQLEVRAETLFIARQHQEDFCQALRIHPSLKYQNEGGPGPKQIIELMRTNISSHEAANGNKKFPYTVDHDINTFLDALIFNWLIGGTDAHAKNYSLLIGGGGMVRLAPLYDIASILAYPDIDPRKAKLAMKIGDRYGLTDVTLSDWRKLATTCRLGADTVIGSIRRMANELPDRLSDEIKLMHESGLRHTVIYKLAALLPKRAAEIAAM